jgi:hypothetical protein
VAQAAAAGSRKRLPCHPGPRRVRAIRPRRRQPQRGSGSLRSAAGRQTGQPAGPATCRRRCTRWWSSARRGGNRWRQRQRRGGTLGGRCSPWRRENRRRRCPLDRWRGLTDHWRRLTQARGWRLPHDWRRLANHRRRRLADNRWRRGALHLLRRGHGRRWRFRNRSLRSHDGWCCDRRRDGRRCLRAGRCGARRLDGRQCTRRLSRRGRRNLRRR